MTCFQQKQTKWTEKIKTISQNLKTISEKNQQTPHDLYQMKYQ